MSAHTVNSLKTIDEDDILSLMDFVTRKQYFDQKKVQKERFIACLVCLCMVFITLCAAILFISTL